MSPGSNKQYTKYYRKSYSASTDSVVLDEGTARVYEVIDETVQLSRVAELAGVNMVVVWKAIAKLSRLGLIEEADDNYAYFEDMLYAEKLQMELAKAVGPMSYFLINSVSGQMDISWPNIPTELSRELVHRLARKIPDERAKIGFQEAMQKS